MLGQAKHPASTSDSADAGGAFTSPTQVSQHMQLQQSLNTPLDSPFSGNHLQYNGSQQQRSSYSNPQTQTQTQTLNTGMNLDPSLAANQGSLSQQPFQMAQLPIVYPVQLKQDISGSHSIAHLGSGININCNKKNTPSIIYNSQLKTESKNSPFHLPISDPTLCGIISRGNQSDRSKANSAGYGHSLAQRVGSQKHTATLGSGSASAAALSSSVSAITSQCNTIQRMLQSRYDGQEGAVAASTTTAANSNSFAALSQNNVPGGSSNPQFTAISRPSVVDSYLSSRGGNMPMFLPGQQTMASTGTSMNTGHGRKQAAHNQFQNHNQGHNLSQSQSQMIPTPGSSGPYFDRVLKITLGQPNPRRPRPRRTRHKKPSLINTDISQNVNSSASQSSAAASSSVSAPPTFMSSIPDPLSLDPTVRPEHSYLRLITEAISSSECGMMSLQEIYDYIKENYVYFRTAPQTWQNSIRHNLSVQKVFEKKPRPHTRAGKGGMWSLAKDASRTDLPLDISISGSSTSASSTSFPDLDYSRQQPKRTRLVNNATNIAFTQLKHQTQPHGLVRHSSQQILHTPSYDQHLQFSGNRSRFLQRSMSLSGVGEDSVLNFNAKRKQECLSFQNGYDALAASYPLNGLNEDETINTMFQRRKSAMYASELGLGIQESFRRMLDMNEGDDGLIDSSILNPSFGSFLPGKIGDLNSSSTTPVDGLSYAHTMGSSAFDFLQNAPETASLVSHARAVTDSIDMSSILCDPYPTRKQSLTSLGGSRFR
ncbi:hypothetical protein BASA62_010211 [Batrachochytrium salamandrivorans]|nr:hypothetical protein BASA62_010211 [Batrachochytrium salamandrivorans]